MDSDQVLVAKGLQYLFQLPSINSSEHLPNEVQKKIVAKMQEITSLILLTSCPTPSISSFIYSFVLQSLENVNCKIDSRKSFVGGWKPKWF